MSALQGVDPGRLPTQSTTKLTTDRKIGTWHTGAVHYITYTLPRQVLLDLCSPENNVKPTHMIAPQEEALIANAASATDFECRVPCSRLLRQPMGFNAKACRLTATSYLNLDSHWARTKVCPTGTGTLSDVPLQRRAN